MKDYKRLTKRCGDIVNYAKPLQSNFIGAIYEEQKERDSEIMSRLAELEDKIESGEEERKQAVKEFAGRLKERFEKTSTMATALHGRKESEITSIIDTVAAEYGVEVEK